MYIVQQGLSWEFETAGARHYCPKNLRVPGTLGTRAKLSPVQYEPSSASYLDHLAAISLDALVVSSLP